jgi:hypothetical protein
MMKAFFAIMMSTQGMGQAGVFLKDVGAGKVWTYESIFMHCYSSP